MITDSRLVRLAIDVAVVSVTVMFVGLSTTTVSPGCGTTPPLQFAGLSQAPSTSLIQMRWVETGASAIVALADVPSTVKMTVSGPSVAASVFGVTVTVADACPAGIPTMKKSVENVINGLLML